MRDMMVESVCGPIAPIGIYPPSSSNIKRILVALTFCLKQLPYKRPNFRYIPDVVFRDKSICISASARSWADFTARIVLTGLFEQQYE